MTASEEQPVKREIAGEDIFMTTKSSLLISKISPSWAYGDGQTLMSEARTI